MVSRVMIHNYEKCCSYAAYTVGTVQSCKMSLEGEMGNHDDHQCSMVDDEAYEPTYAEAFPPLPASPDTVDWLQDTAASNKWAVATNKMAVRSSVITQVNSSNIYYLSHI